MRSIRDSSACSSFKTARMKSRAGVGCSRRLRSRLRMFDASGRDSTTALPSPTESPRRTKASPRASAAVESMVESVCGSRQSRLSGAKNRPTDGIISSIQPPSDRRPASSRLSQKTSQIVFAQQHRLAEAGSSTHAAPESNSRLGRLVEKCLPERICTGSIRVHGKDLAVGCNLVRSRGHQGFVQDRCALQGRIAGIKQERGHPAFALRYRRFLLEMFQRRQQILPACGDLAEQVRHLAKLRLDGPARGAADRSLVRNSPKAYVAAMIRQTASPRRVR